MECKCALCGEPLYEDDDYVQVSGGLMHRPCMEWLFSDAGKSYRREMQRARREADRAEIAALRAEVERLKEAR